MIGQVLDLDSHEMIPAHKMGETFGEIGASFADFLERRQRRTGDTSAHSMVQSGVEDVKPIDATTVWTEKGPAAPGAIDLRRRLEVIDTMGVSAQLVFPTFGLAGLLIAGISDTGFKAIFGEDLGQDRREFGLAMVDAANRWALHQPEVDSQRIRVVAILPSDELAQLESEARRLIDGGARALWMSASVPPGGMSPADGRLDPFWALVAKRDVPIVLHIGTEFGFLDGVWRDPKRFISKASSVEAPVLDIYTLSTFHYAVENFLTAMVLGGVFDRHPRLRFGVIECSASWVGPLARRIDMMADLLKANHDLPLPPSQYLARNVRVTPFWFEPVDEYFASYPDLADVYCYSTDYPHMEGGKESKRVLHDKLAPLGETVIDRFFCSNAELILPGLERAVSARCAR